MLGLAQIGSSPKMTSTIKWIRANPFLEPCTSGLCGFPAKEVVGNFPLVRIQQAPYGKECSYLNFFREKKSYTLRQLCRCSSNG